MKARNKFSFLLSRELINCSEILEELPPGPAKDYAQELTRRFENICDTAVVRCGTHEIQLREAINGKL